MHPARGAIHRQRQLVGVGGFEFRHAAIFEQYLGQRIIQRELLQHFFIGGRIAARGFFLHRQLQLVEQDFSQLLGRIEVERLSGSLVRTGFQRDEFFAQLAALNLQQRAIQQHAVALHHIQHMHAGHFDVAIDMLQAALRFDLRGERVVQLQRDVGIFGGITRGGIQIDLIETQLLRTLADHFRIADGLHIEMAQREVIHVVRLVRFQHIGLQQRVLGNARKRDTMIGENVSIVFEVLPEFLVLHALQPALQFLQSRVAFELVGCAGIDVRQRQICRLVRRDGERDTDQLRVHHIQAGGLGIDTHQPGCEQFFQP